MHVAEKGRVHGLRDEIRHPENVIPRTSEIPCDRCDGKGEEMTSELPAGEATVRMTQKTYEEVCRDNNIAYAEYFMGYRIIIDETLSGGDAMKLYDETGAYLGTLPMKY